MGASSVDNMGADSCDVTIRVGIKQAVTHRQQQNISCFILLLLSLNIVYVTLTPRVSLLGSFTHSHILHFYEILPRESISKRPFLKK